MIRRRPLLRTAAVGGIAYAAGSHAATKSAQQTQMDAQQSAQIADLQQQQAAQQQQPVAPPPTAVYQQPVAPPPVAAYQQPVAPPPVAAPQQPAEPPPAAPDPSSSATPGTLEQLKLLGDLHASNVLTDDEFNAAKQKILGQL